MPLQTALGPGPWVQPDAGDRSSVEEDKADNARGQAKVVVVTAH